MASIFSEAVVRSAMDDLHIAELNTATIRQVLSLASELERRTGIPFVRMEQGVPGLPPCEIGVRAEIEALQSGVASQYPPSEGVGALKSAASEFVKGFFNVDVSPAACLPTTGSVSGSFAAFALLGHLDAKRNKILYIDPGFPIQKLQLRVLGLEERSFEIFEYRGGDALRSKLEEEFSAGDIAAVVYSSPNNPSWITFTEEELRAIGECASQYDVVVVEDLAYLGMDSREDYSQPCREPYIPTVANYTDNYILLISGSKIYSYAGQRIAVMCISDKLFNRTYEALDDRYKRGGHFGVSMVGGVMDMLSSGVNHSSQYGLAAMLRASVSGDYDFVEQTSDYSRRAVKMKEIFRKRGFHIVYDKDLDREIGDGFFFTIGYKGMSCSELVSSLLYYGVSSVSLSSMGSNREGIRACTSRMSSDMFDILDERLRAFDADHK